MDLGLHPPPSGSARAARFAAILVAAVALLATWPARQGTFIYDDQYYVVENPAVSGGASPWTSSLGLDEQALWRPLTVASWRLQWADAAGTAGRMKLANVLLHVAISVLLLPLARRLGLGTGGSLAAALLFAAHPIHAEAVAWISGRSELLATGLLLGAWLAHLSPHRLAAWLSAALVGAACLCKESAFVAPLLFLAADLLLRRRVRPGRVALQVGACALIAVLHVLVAGRPLPGDAPFADVPALARLGVAAQIMGRALLLLGWPHPLVVFRPREDFLGWHALPWMALLLVALAALALWRRQRLAAACLALLPISMLAVLNLVPIGATSAERFLYLPSALSCCAAGALLEAAGRAERRSGRGLGLSLLLPLIVLAVWVPACRRDVEFFRDDLTLWAHAAEVRPDVAHIRYNHGYFLEAEGRTLAEDIDRPDAASELTASLAIAPHHLYAGLAHHELGRIALAGRGPRPPDTLRAAEHFRQAIALLPGHADSRIDLAAIAAAAPTLVAPQEGWAALQPLVGSPGLSPAQQQAVTALSTSLAQLLGASGSASPMTGTSSPDGS
jgi:hypothetical protein